jgi:hypothetical protein
MTTGYHVTTDNNLARITSQGLIPQIGERSADLGEPVPAVYLFPSLADLEDALGGWLGECFEDYEDSLHVLKVDLTDAVIDQEVEWELKCYDAIPADRISYLRCE